MEKIAKILIDFTDETTNLPWNICPFLLILCFPCLFGYVITGIILSSLFSAIYIVYVKKWVWKSDITMISLTIAIIASTFHILNWVTTNDHIQTIWQTFALLGLFLYTSTVFLLLTIPTICIAAFIALKFVAKNPGKSLTTLGDWDVIP